LETLKSEIKQSSERNKTLI